MRPGALPLLALPWLVLLALDTAAEARPLPAWQMVMTREEGPVDPQVQARYTRAHSACQSRAVTTDDNARCFMAEFPRQDGALNAVWRKALAAIPSADKPGLLAAQRQWIAARDPFCRKVTDAFAGGSIQPIIWHNCRAEQTIRRTLWLERVAKR